MFVGRRDELAAFRLALSESGRPWCLEVAGEPGMGRTALLAEFVTAARRAGAMVLAGRATGNERTVPLDMFNNALGELPAQPIPLGPLAGVTGSDWSLLRSAFPALDGPGSSPPGAADRRHLHRAVQLLLGGLAAGRRLLIALDDVHRAGSQSAELLEYLLEHPPGPRVMMVLTYRPRQLGPQVAAALTARGARWTGDRIELGPLDAAEAGRLLGPEVTGSRLERIYQESGGNPLYLQALSHDTGVRWPQPSYGPTTVPGLPWAIRMTLQAELDTLGEIPQLVARAAAVTGQDVQPALTATAAGLPLRAALDGLDVLKEHDIIRPSWPGARFSFRHPVVRQAVYETSGAGWLVGAHLRVARELEKSGRPATERAWHVERYAEPGDEDAIDLLTSAAEAIHEQAPATAATWLETALALLPEGQRQRRLLMLERLAQLLGNSGEHSHSMDKLAEILAFLPRGAGRTTAARMYALLARRLGRASEARIMLQRELDVVDPNNPETAALLIELAHACFTETWDGGGLRHAETAHALASRGNQRAQTAYAAATIALALILSGKVSAGRQRLDEAVGIVTSLPDSALLGQLELFVTICWACVMTERYQTGVVHLYRGLSLARSSGQDHLLPPLLVLLSYTSVVLGNPKEARVYAEEAAEAALESGTPAYFLIATTAQSLGPGNPADPVAALETAMKQAKDPPDLMACQALFDLACSAVRGKCSAADVERLLRIGGGETLPRVTITRRARGHEALTRGRLQTNEPGLARRHARYAADVAARLPLDSPKGYAELALAQVKATEDPAAAARHAETALGYFERVGVITTAARARQLAAEIRESADRTPPEASRPAPDGPVRHPAGDTSLDVHTLLARLSPREREVALFVADAHSNRQIARMLGIAERTVEAHVTHILRKLKLRSRAAITKAVAASSAQSAVLDI